MPRFAFPLILSLLGAGCIDWEEARQAACAKTLCDGECVDPQTDAAHCGACGKACAQSEQCHAGACSGGTLGLGEACHPGQCASGFCVDGVCCDAACEGQCEYCAAAGHCEATTGAPVGSRSACAGEGTVCGGHCDGTTRGSCAYPEVECRAAACVSGSQVSSALCAQGACPAAEPTACRLGECLDDRACLTVASFDVGSLHACAALSNGTVRCWGNGENGQLGQGADRTIRTQPTAVPGLTDVVEVALGSSHTCVRHAGGTVSCWGYNNAGQAGGSVNPIASPRRQGGLAGIKSLGLGDSHSCAVTETGRAWCWGLNAEGELGTGSSATSYTPVPQRVCPVGSSGDCEAQFASNIASIAGGNYTTCALTTDGQVACWGLNSQGEAGQNSSIGTVLNPTPVPLPFGAIASVELGARSGCAATVSGEAYCWGINANGVLGNPAISTFTSNPTRVCSDATCTATLSGVQQLALTGSSACALRLSGGALCWGGNAFGQLGDDTKTQRPTPVAGGVSSSATRVRLGGTHACALRGRDELRCWGQNNFGQLGNGDADLKEQLQSTEVKWK